MRLAVRMALIITGAVALGILAIFWIAGVVLVDGFKAVEAQSVAQEVGFLRSSVAQDEERLDRITKDWAHWNDTWDFMHGLDGDYPESNVQPASMLANQIDFMAFMAPDGSLHYGRSLQEGQLAPPPQVFEDGSWQGLGLVPGLGPRDRVVGLVELEGAVHMVAARTILHGDETGPPAGTLVWGRAIGEDYEQALAQRMGLPVELGPWQPGMPEDHRRVERSWSRMEVQATLEGIDGDPLLTASYAAPRPVFEQGLSSMTYFFMMAVTSSLLFLLVGLVIVRSNVTRPVERLATRMRRLADGEHDPPVVYRRNDEVARLAAIFEELMATLHSTIAELQRSNQDLEDFARVASHDLKSPLSTFNLNLTLLRPHLEGNPTALGEVDRLERASARMSERVDGLLEYSRARSKPLEWSVVDLGEVVQAVLVDLEAEIEDAQAIVEVGPLPSIEADASQMAQLMQNLLSNAIKYRKPGQPAHVRVSSTSDGDTVRIAVQDDGIGFDPADAQHIVHPFTRLANARDRDGHGVGMATCDRIVERHGGRLHIHGELDVGATIVAQLPRRRPH